MAHEGKVDEEVQESEQAMQPQELTPEGGGEGGTQDSYVLQASGAPQGCYTPITPSVCPNIPPTTTNRTSNGPDPGWD